MLKSNLVISNEALSFCTAQLFKMYSYQQEIQSGSYGRVLQIERDGVSYAVKEFLVTSPKATILGAINLKEVDFMKRCEHPNIIAPKAITYGIPYKGNPPPLKKGVTDSVYVIMPLAEETLYDFMRRNDCTTPMLKRFMLQITQALAYLHSHKICYRDVKSGNVLIFRDQNGIPNAVLCDLGMCKPLTDGQLNSDHVGTSMYKSPEVMLSSGSYSLPMDVWALGILFFEMFNFTMPFERQREKGNNKKLNMETHEIITKIFHSRGSPDIKLFNRLTNGGNTVIDFQKIAKYSKRPISKLFDRGSRHIKQFEPTGHVSDEYSGESPVESDSDVEVITSEGRQKSSERTRAIKLKDFGTLQEYEALLERILQVDPNARPTMAQVLDDPFFKDVPRVISSPRLNDSLWAGLCNQRPEDEQSHVLRKIDNDALRSQGFSIFTSLLATDFYPDDILRQRILFLGFDMYDRCLLKLVESKADADIKLLALVCCYVACKYFMDESTPPLRVIFPKASYEKADIIKMEQKILIELLDWKIYRKTIYDLLENKLKPEALLEVLQTKPAVYGHRIDKIASIYVKNVGSSVSPNAK